MAPLARALARLVALILATALALAGLAVALFSIQGGDSALSLPNLADLLALDDLHAEVGSLLDGLEADGPVAVQAALLGAGAVALGLLLAFGALARRRERLVVMRSGADGRIAARSRAVGQAAAALAERSRDVARVKPRTRARRRGNGGRLRLTVYHPQTSDEHGVASAARDRVQKLAEAFSLRLDVRTRVPRRGGRVS